MPRSGGIYSAPSGSKGVPNTTIQSAPYNALIDDLTNDANAPRPVTAGGTGATDATAARTNLGVVIGTNTQAYDPGLTSIANLSTANNQMLYTLDTDIWAVTTITAFGRTLVDDPDAVTARATLGANNADNLTAGTVGDGRLPAAMSSKTFNTKVTVNCSGAEGAGNRGYRWWVDGTEYGSMYFDNTKMVLNTPNKLAIFSTQGLEVNGGKIVNHVGGGSSAADRGYRWLIDGNEQSAMYYDNNNMILNTGGTLVLNGFPVVRSNGDGYNLSISGNAATATTADNSINLGGVAAASYLQTANLRSEYAGIGVDEVGSVAMLSRIGAGTFNAGDTSIGSSLRYANVDNTSVSATAPNGTWRCHGRATGGGGTASITLWKRIA